MNTRTLAIAVLLCLCCVLNTVHAQYAYPEVMVREERSDYWSGLLRKELQKIKQREDENLAEVLRFG